MDALMSLLHELWFWAMVLPAFLYGWYPAAIVGAVGALLVWRARGAVGRGVGVAALLWGALMIAVVGLMSRSDGL